MSERPSSSELHKAVWTLAPCVRPISIIKEGSGGKRFTGSAFVVAFRDFRLVLTAEHTVRGPQRKLLGMSGAGSLPWPVDYKRIVSIDPTVDDPDVAVAAARVEGEAAGSTPAIPIELFLPNCTFDAGSSMVALGFPGSKAKTLYSENALRSKLMSAVGDLAEESAYAAIGKRPETHLAMSYRQEAFVDESGSPASAAHPRGMSGGMMLAASYVTDSNGNESFSPRVVGVITEYHGDPVNLLVAARIECVLDALGIVPLGERPRYRAVDV